MVNDPVFVGAEEMNGVMTKPFHLHRQRVGDESGAEVVASTGEYWLAQDGQYIVKYLVVMKPATAGWRCQHPDAALRVLHRSPEHQPGGRDHPTSRVPVGISIP